MYSPNSRSIFENPPKDLIRAVLDEHDTEDLTYEQAAKMVTFEAVLHQIADEVSEKWPDAGQKFAQAKGEGIPPLIDKPVAPFFCFRAHYTGGDVQNGTAKTSESVITKDAACIIASGIFILRIVSFVPAWYPSTLEQFSKLLQSHRVCSHLKTLKFSLFPTPLSPWYV